MNRRDEGASGPVLLAPDSLSDAERAAVEELRALRGPLTLAECGARLGLSRERVRQIERDALEKLRRLAIERPAVRTELIDRALDRARAGSRR